MTGTDQPETASYLRSRADHVRGLGMQLSSASDRDRLRDYADEL